MSIDIVQHQLKVTLYITEARIVELGEVRARLYESFGQLLNVTDKAMEACVKYTCTYTQVDDDLLRYRHAVDTFLHIVTPILRMEDQEQLLGMKDEGQAGDLTYTGAGDSDAGIPGVAETTKVPF